MSAYYTNTYKPKIKKYKNKDQYYTFPHTFQRDSRHPQHLSPHIYLVHKECGKKKKKSYQDMRFQLQNLAENSD